MKLTTLAARYSPVFFFSTTKVNNLKVLTLVDFSERATSELLDDAVALVQDFLALHKHLNNKPAPQP